MEENQFKCSGDCLNCRKLPNERREQWQYCSAQFTYNSMRILGDMQEQLKAMQGTVDELNVKIEAIQNSEANVFNPNEELHDLEANDTDESRNLAVSPTEQPIAQSGDGAV